MQCLCEIMYKIDQRDTTQEYLWMSFKDLGLFREWIIFIHSFMTIGLYYGECKSYKLLTEDVFSIWFNGRSWNKMIAKFFCLGSLVTKVFLWLVLINLRLQSKTLLTFVLTLETFSFKPIEISIYLFFWN